MESIINILIIKSYGGYRVKPPEMSIINLISNRLQGRASYRDAYSLFSKSCETMTESVNSHIRQLNFNRL